MTTKERLDKIEARLGALESNGPQGTMRHEPSAPQSFWQNKKRKIWGIVVLLLVPILAICIPIYREHAKSDFDHAVDDRMNPKFQELNTQLKESSAKLTKLDATLATLQPYIEDLVRRQMDKVSSLPLSEFKANLPAIQHLVTVARERGVKVNPELIRRMSDKLLDVKPRAPEFWPLSAELVSYKSQNLVSRETQLLLTPQLPHCTDAPPTPAKITSVLSSTTVTVSKAFYEKCQIALDSAQDNERINSFLLNYYPFITFRHCVVLYQGGPVSLILVWKEHLETLHVEGHPPMPIKVSGKTLEFEECLFEFTIQSVPPPTGQQLTQALLAQNGPKPQLPRP